LFFYGGHFRPSGSEYTESPFPHGSTSSAE
jgi:hypothetical protein